MFSILRKSSFNFFGRNGVYTRMVYEQLQCSYIHSFINVRCTGGLPDFWGYISIPYPVSLQYIVTTLNEWYYSS